MSIREAVIRLSANSAGFQSGVTRAASVGRRFYSDMESGERRLAIAQRQTQRELSNLTGQLAGVRSAASGLTGIVAGAFATTQLIKYADTWTLLGSRINLASTSSAEAAQNLSMLMEISQRTGTSFEANATLFSRVSKGMRQLGYDAKDTGRLTEMLATSLRLSGASTEEASSVTVQFSQAIASGVLRGEEFNAIMENGSRFAGALADGLGVTVGQLRAMANAGQLTTDRIMPALLEQFYKVREEGAKLGATVASAMQRVQNAFTQYVGTTNDGVGASALLASGLDSLARNISGVADVAGILIGLGLARYFGNMAIAANASVASIVRAAASESQLAKAQAATAATAAAVARAEAQRAAMARLSATSVEAQLVAERQLTVARANVIRTADAAAAAAGRVSTATGAIMGLGRGLLGLFGGLPGLLLIAAGAAFMVSQRMEQTHKAAVAYADQLNVINEKLKTMSATQAAATAVDLRGSLEAQKKDLDDVNQKLAEVNDQIKAGQALRKDYDRSPTSAAINNLMSRETLEKNISEAVDAQTKLEAQRESIVAKVAATQETLNTVSTAATQKAYDQASAVNILSGAYNILDKAMGKVTAKGSQTVSPVVTTEGLNAQQLKAWQQAQDTLNNSTLTGLEKQHALHEQQARDLGLIGAQYTTYVSKLDQAAQNEKNIADARTAATKAQRDANREMKAAEKIQQDYQDKMRQVSDAIEVATVRMREGKDAADLYATTQTGNIKWSNAEIETYRLKRNELERLSQQIDKNEEKTRLQIESSKKLSEMAKQTAADLALQASAATPMNTGQRDLLANRVQAQSTYDASAKTPADLENLNKSLDALNAKFTLMNQQRQDWSTGVQQGWADWTYQLTDYASQAAEGVSTVMGGALTGITDMLEGNKSSWKDWGISVIKVVEQIALKMAVAGLIGSIGSAFAGGAASSGTSAGSSFSSGAYSNLSFNALGGSYSNSPSLSKYSGSVVSSPTMFAFAKGAGLMGEAGPEAILPLKRGSDGKLGVSMPGGGSNGSGITVNSTVNVYGGGGSDSQSSGASDAVGKAYQQVIDDAVQTGIQKELKQGGKIWRAMNGR